MISFVLLAVVAFCLCEADPSGVYAGHGGHGHGGHGHGGHGHAGYGHAGYANVGYGHAGYGNVGYGHYAKAAPHNGYEADVNKNNAARQLGVNHRAQYVGSGTGTARKDGVPGTPLGRTGYDKYSYGHGYGHGNGYGHGHGYGHGNGYANGYGHGNKGYGYANNGYGHGVQAAYGHGYGNVAYGKH